jgi:hypothetical protein
MRLHQSLPTIAVLSLQSQNAVIATQVPGTAMGMEGALGGKILVPRPSCRTKLPVVEPAPIQSETPPDPVGTEEPPVDTNSPNDFLPGLSSSGASLIVCTN